MKQKSRTLRGCLRCVDLFGKCLMFFDLNAEMVKKKKKKKKSPSPWQVTSLWRLKLPHDGSSSWIMRASSLVGVLQLFTSSKDCWSVEEQTACGLIPSALTAASVFILFTAQSVPVAWSCLLVGGERRWLNWKTKKEEIRCLTLDSGCYF